MNKKGKSGLNQVINHIPIMCSSCDTFSEFEFKKYNNFMNTNNTSH